MRQSSGEPIISTKELNKILPSYLLSEMDEDNKNEIQKEEIKTNNFYDEKVSKIFII